MNYLLHYRRWHDGSDTDYDSAKKLYYHLLENFCNENRHAQKVLDYGCGSGLLVNYLCTKFGNVQGLDASKELISVGQKRDLPIDYLSTFEYNKWAEKNIGNFDLIFLFDVLEHIPISSQFNFLKQLSSTLAPHGKLIIKVPNAVSPVASRWRYIDWTHCTSFTEESLEFLASNCGLILNKYMRDETSLKRKFPIIPRKGIGFYWFKFLYRKIYQKMLEVETGMKYKNLGSNLLAVFVKK